ncbi:hypothetical protein [uncultured Psychroserpens sp.]|uniref:hypothetical protein n=1 Tax=uncultured Psychroserpens sp. TaxID=255436 RepID=UPI00261E730C|nr:hypothetical protein [uncultured Psychroserpens sp.]
MKIKYTTITNNELLDAYPQVHYDLNYYYSIGNIESDKKALSEKINNSIVNKTYYKDHWENGFIAKLKSHLDIQEIYPTTAGLVPNFSGVIKLREDGNFKTELHFYKSLINDYFTIEILELNTHKKVVHPILGEKTIVGVDTITVSPIGKYKDLFHQVLKCISQEYETSKFIPYVFDTIRLEGLNLKYKQEKNCTISSALFQKYSVYNDTIEVIGDVEFGLEILKN